MLTEQNLHQALAPETFVQRKSRLDALSQARTPLEFATLRDDWAMEARLVPIDHRIALGASAIATQARQAGQLGIRSDPAALSTATLAACSQDSALVPMTSMTL